ncbi:Chemotaxis protein methyltransferase [Paenibacillus plantiphilus]|uniref:protein-glutamate O-methyltransferase n=1 Tax=Paenibacillus plantiphilus TaxID=2905650 RepID=A0ABM9CKZ2_9BACL|nr:protein-glutamate O-methyltransferase CheR [Paenibacillus plantiphilus]CAH1214917.1 Chemotaxis protein methyltransferase [Paenibacillus plantiphilus]
MITITDHEFKKLSALVKSNYGIKLGDEKRSLVVGRLHNVLLHKNFDNFTEYYDYVVTDTTGEALTTLVEKLTTNHTYFMREIAHFNFFRDHVLPHIKETERSKDLRIWSAGCSTGEEPYTLAMIIADWVGFNQDGWETRILATDISSKVLEAAKRGEYQLEQLASIPAPWRKKYLRKVNEERGMFIEQIRNEVIFRLFNLMEPVFPFKRKFHAIFCRNVMIYFDAATRKALINRFYEIMEPGGYLFLGHSESLSRHESNYQYVMPSVYRKG